MPGALAVKVRVTVAPTAASVPPAVNEMPGISNDSVCPAGSALVTSIVTESPSFTTSCGPGRFAVAVAQSPGVFGMPKPQIGTVTAGALVGSGAALPGTAQRSTDTDAADAVEPAATSPAPATTITNSALVFLSANMRIASRSFASLLLMARHRRGPGGCPTSR